MDPNETTEPNANQIYEVLKQDPDHTFSDETLMKISENIANAESSDNWQTVETVEELIQCLRERWK